MKNKNLTPDQNGEYKVKLCTLGVIARSNNIIEWIDVVNLGDLTIFICSQGAPVLRVNKVHVEHDTENGAILTATVKPYCAESLEILQSHSFVFKPTFRNDEPTNNLITFVLHIEE